MRLCSTPDRAVLRSSSISSRGRRNTSGRFSYAIETGISSSLLSHLACVQTLPYLTLQVQRLDEHEEWF